jgi:hypothetical protein
MAAGEWTLGSEADLNSEAFGTRNPPANPSESLGADHLA